MSVAVAEEVARKLGGEAVLGTSVRSQADLALAVRDHLPLATPEGLAEEDLPANWRRQEAWTQ